MYPTPRKLLLPLFALAVAATAALPAMARNGVPPAGVTKTDLTDGSTLYRFADGKMALESKYGRATRIQPGSIVQTKDGQQITVTSDEVARLDGLLRDGHPRN